MDPFRGYVNAIRDELPEAITVLDAFHVGKLGRPWSMRSAAGTSRTSWDAAAASALRSTEPQDPADRSRTPHRETGFPARREAHRREPGPRSHPARQCYQKLRNIDHARPEQGRATVSEVIASFPSWPIPEVARLGRTLKQWKTAILVYCDTNGASNGPTEAHNGVIDTIRRIARAFRDFTTYRLRCLVAARSHRPYRAKQMNRA
ncbi:transposase [Pseudarthrobacter sp. B907]|uniref:transposase n=1 Tax=Pseudarthrobacter sp. B907 TaxID=3158261 RepID=UPI0032DBEC21